MVSHNHNVAAKDSFLKNTYLMAMTVSHLQEYGEKWCLLKRGIDKQRLPGRSTRRVMGRHPFFYVSTGTVARSAG